MQSQDIFCIPILDRYLLYAPRHDLIACMNRSAIRALRAGFDCRAPVPGELQSTLAELRSPGLPLSTLPMNRLVDPIFLGLVTTRGCNMDCHYCDFNPSAEVNGEMSIDTARFAIDAFINLMCAAHRKLVEIHFFGGEPLFAWDVIFFSVEYAQMRAAELGLDVRFEVITNGLISKSRCLWVANHFDTVILSLDGPAEIQELHRPGRGNQAAAPVVLANAKILAEQANELALRACVSSESVGQMGEISTWMAEQFYPTSVCFESLTPSNRSIEFHLEPPDPFEFTRGFMTAARIFEPMGIETILSTANLNTLQSSFCPVGKDALIVLPDGSVDACYWQESEWKNRGINLHIGRLGITGFDLDPEAIHQARYLTTQYKEPCADCFCQFHCAGGCHVRRAGMPSVRRTAEVCIQTRLITLARLLQRSGQDSIIDTWLSDQAELEKVAYRDNDRLSNGEVTV